ncbi:MAG TPA: hypothetical protein VHX16_15580 [Chloroflexota bacterium]|nr:hypothetical protein [Chloroflexota bacterium]
MYLNDTDLNTALARLTAARLALQLLRRQGGLPASLETTVSVATRSMDDLVPLLTRERPRNLAPDSRHSGRPLQWPIKLARILLRPAAHAARTAVQSVCLRTTHTLGRV